MHFINAFGEELIIDNAEKALAIACKSSGASIKDYTAAPVYFDAENGGAHEWLIEFVTPPIDITDFSVYLDNALKEINSDYEAKRYRDKVLSLPIVRSLPCNTFHNWMKSREKLGGQHKVPRLANHRNYVDEILNNFELNV
jgi:hypothetical protein